MVNGLEFTFGISLTKIKRSDDPETPPEEENFRFSGRYPSASLPDLQAVADAVMAFLNKHIGTNWTPVELYTEEQVEELAPGEYALKDA